MGLKKKKRDRMEAKQAAKSVCPECKSSIPAGSEYCPECGFSFEVTEKPAEPEPIPQPVEEKPEPTQTVPDFPTEVTADFDSLEAELEEPPAEPPVEEKIDDLSDFPSETVETTTEVDLDAVSEDFDLEGEFMDDGSEEAEGEFVYNDETYDEDGEYYDENEDGEEEYVEEDIIICPQCEAENEIGSAFCRECGYQIGEVDEEIAQSTALFNAASDIELVDFRKLDLTNAMPGEKVVLKQTGVDEYEVITAPPNYPVYVLKCTDIEADVLKIDYMLRKTDLTLREKVEAYCFLNEHIDTVINLFGTPSIDAIYGEDTLRYINLKDVADELLATNLPYETMHILSGLTATKQKMVAKVLDDLKITHISNASAREIVSEKDVTEESVKAIALQDAKMYEMLNSILGSRA